MTATERRNLVLVTIDSLRGDCCGYIDTRRNAMPVLTEMATSGTGFERAIAPGPSTPESMPAIFTGQYPTNDGEEMGQLAERRERIRRHMLSRDTLPERLSRQGYRTAAFTPNPFTSRYFGFDSGFDHFQDFMGERRRTGDLYEQIFEGFLDGDPTSSLVRVLLNFWQREEVFKPWESYYDQVVDWARSAEEPYFIWVFLMDVHNPYLPGADHRSQSRLKQFHANFEFWREDHETPFTDPVHDRLRTAYEDAVRYADRFLARLQSDLKEDDPVFVVHGDHGEAFGEHGSYGHEPYLYPENVHVPLVISDGERGNVSSPVSLRKLPDLVTAAGSDTLSDFTTNPYALTHTVMGDAVAVYTEDTDYIRNGTRSETAPRETTEAFEELISTFETFQREKQLSAEAVERVTET